MSTNPTRKRRLFVAVFAIAFAVASFFLVRSRSKSTAPVEVPAGVPTAEASPSPLPEAFGYVLPSTPTPEVTGAIGHASRNDRIIDQVPSPEVYRKEVAEDPHSPPPSMLRFAAGLAPRFAEAQKSPAKADEFYDDLRECAEGANVPQSAKALCIVNIRDLGKKVPALRARSEAYWDRADPKLKRLAP
jgi:hypothetical protein